jgi:hypothetical protein
MRILFLMRNAGYVNHYESTLRLLAERGHRIFLAARRKKSRDPLDWSPSLERLCREYPQITIHSVPLRKDQWAALAEAARALRTYSRYLHPRYEIAHTLRNRAAQQVARITGIRHLPRGRVSGSAVAAAAWMLERLIPPDAAVERVIESFSPDVLVVTPLIDYGSYQPDYVKGARRLGIPTVWAVASWDNLTNKGVVPVVPDRVLVWNEAQRCEAVELHRIPAGRVVVTGAQTFDPWFTMRPSIAHEAFTDLVGLPRGRFLLYICSSVFIAPDEVKFVRQWLAQVRASPHPLLRECGVLIRPHPANAGQWGSADLQDPRVSVWPRAGDLPLESDAKQRYFDSLFHASAIVGVNSSGMIEAGVVGRRSFTFLAPEFAHSQQGTLHFEYLTSYGFLTAAPTWAEHLDHLDGALRGEAVVDEALRRRMMAFVRPDDAAEPSTPRVAAAIEAAASGSRRHTPARRPSAFVLRALAPLAAMAVRRREAERQARRSPG